MGLRKISTKDTFNEGIDSLSAIVEHLSEEGDMTPELAKHINNLQLVFIAFSELQHLLSHVNKYSLADAVADHKNCVLQGKENG